MHLYIKGSNSKVTLILTFWKSLMKASAQCWQKLVVRVAVCQLELYEVAKKFDQLWPTKMAFSYVQPNTENRVYASYGRFTTQMQNVQLYPKLRLIMYDCISPNFSTSWLNFNKCSYNAFSQWILWNLLNVCCWEYSIYNCQHFTIYKGNTRCVHENFTNHEEAGLIKVFRARIYVRICTKPSDRWIPQTSSRCIV